MDTSDPEITFDSSGRCNHCRAFDAEVGRSWFPNAQGRLLLEDLLQRIKEGGRGKAYDCVLGLSGGIDSSYLALMAHEWGLRPLVVHVDAGWNSELAVQNIERVVNHCGYELHTHVVNWPAMRELQLAFLRAGVANQDVPQDHAFFAALYKFALEEDIRTVLNGGNAATEWIFPRAWLGTAMDARNIKDIYRKYGRGSLTDYPTISFSDYYIWYPLVRRMTPVRPLNYLDYSQKAATESLVSIGWRPYLRKHGESVFTKFFQDYYLPTKFGYDKRRPHLSTLVCSGELTRMEALTLLQEPLYDPVELRRDRSFVIRKLQLSEDEFDELMRCPTHEYSDFKNWDFQYSLLKRAQRFASAVSGRRLSRYS